jgi:predicted DNA-binding protein
MKLKNKQKVEVFLTDAIKAKLKGRAEETGSTMSEIIKRALDSYFEK